MKDETKTAMQNCYNFLCGELEILDDKQDREEIAVVQALIADIQRAYNAEKE